MTNTNTTMIIPMLLTITKLMNINIGCRLPGRARPPGPLPGPSPAPRWLPIGLRVK